MAQSYKIFINENPVHIITGVPGTSDKQGDDMHPIYTADQEKEHAKAFHLLQNHAGVKSLTIYTDNAKQTRNTLFAGYKKIAAAGGLVFNHRGQVLLIFRRHMWDLPKGKIDTGEGKKLAALREVREETGLQRLSIIKKLTKTWHTYQLENNTPVLKVTHWYLMMSNDDAAPVPQLEEDIEIAKWMEPEQAEDICKTTYANVREVIQSGILMMHYG